MADFPAWFGVAAVAATLIACGADVVRNSGSSGAGPGANSGAGGGAVVVVGAANVFVSRLSQTEVDKVDLLLMIDSSASMADKQQLLKDAMPALVSRLTSPICTDDTGAPLGSSSVNGACAKGQPEFRAVTDIHIGIVSSSLGSHGGSVCGSASSAGDTPNDNAHLIGSLRPARFPITQSWNGTGFLAWDPTGTKNSPPGAGDLTTFTTALQDMILATGERGCGYEASLESWYRFLIDPEPPANVGLSPNGLSTVRGSALNPSNNVCTGCDEVLLAQRRAFLRPDSLVAIVMMSDENDCSIRDDGVGWFVGSTSRMPRSTKICETDPNDVCCRSCANNDGAAPPAGCQALSADPNCGSKDPGQSFATWDAQHDSLNLRCYNQHQRFGFDLLYPTARYVEALTSRTLPLQSAPNTTVTNPLYDDAGSGKAARDPSLVLLAGIVGVPWQDIADDASLTGPGLKYLTATELAQPDGSGRTRWDYLLGSPAASPVVPPADPFMRETPTPRSGTSELAHVALTPETSMNPRANPINGHEHNIPRFDDLQYACIFPKAATDCMAGDAACDCAPAADGSTADITLANSPLCQPPGGGAPGTTQYYAKAYPGARELQVLKDIGDHAVVASICPKVNDGANPAQDPNYGYGPAVTAIVGRLKEALGDKCLPRSLATDAEGRVICSVIEAQQANCDCAQPGRGMPNATLVSAVRTELRRSGDCGGTGQAACSDFCQCEILQESGDDLAACKAGAEGLPAGYCYADEGPLVARCPASQRQRLRFVSAPDAPTPAPDALTFIACAGTPLAPSGGGAAAH